MNRALWMHSSCHFPDHDHLIMFGVAFRDIRAKEPLTSIAKVSDIHVVYCA